MASQTHHSSTLHHHEGHLLLTLNYSSLEYSLSVPNHLHAYATRTRDTFGACLVKKYSTTLPSSNTELLIYYLGFVAKATDAEVHKNEIELVQLLLDDFEATYLKGEDIHIFAAELLCDEPKKQIIIKSYYDAIIFTQRAPQHHKSSMFQASREETGKCLYLVFGGQGNTDHYFDEFRNTYSTCLSFVDELVCKLTNKLTALAAEAAAEQQFCEGINVLRWLREPDSAPSAKYLLSAPISFPLIGLAQLVNYYVTCKTMEKTPGELLGQLKGITGHSQGIVVAAAVATANTWEDFDRVAESALTILFYIGYRSQQVYPETGLPQDIINQALSNDDGLPTPMLNVVHLSHRQLQDQIDLVNTHLPINQRIGIALINGAQNFVVAGSPLSLHGFNTHLRRLKAPEILNQNRIVFKDRKPHITTRFLPVTVPFHSPYLSAMVSTIEEDIRRHNLSIRSSDLRVPVYHTETGQNLQNIASDNLVPEIGSMITTKVVDWPLATCFPGATHVLDFGPGNTSGVGALVQRIKEGQGVQVILATVLSGLNSQFGYKAQMFASKPFLQKPADWAKDYAPSLVKDISGRIMVNTRFSKLLGLPPVMIAGMTPTTVPYDFVAAAMKAGYHIELASGGYFNAESLTEAINELESCIPAGRGITINLIYSNPRAIQWQIPLIRQLQADGHYIEGITIGAGVPSLDVAKEYIDTLGLKHISFKPGSVDAIQQVISIAKAKPTFPVILQWTGGRGGGHHSFEDFHEPILQTYGKIRQCKNIILVAGSGFGGSEDTYPYITGTWSNIFGRPLMPFDGCLFGSRMMVAKEAHTSRPAKLAIANTGGLPNDQWEETYKGAAGGIITVISEMGQPIHKVATRGVLLWAEFDRTIFRLEKSKQALELKRQRHYIIERLNHDYQKVWFGRNEAGASVDIVHMTYAEILVRTVDLLYIRRQSRWIHKSYIRLVKDFVQRLEERLGSSFQDQRVRIYSSHDFSQPAAVLEVVLHEYPLAKTQLISTEDAQYFLMICRRPNQKPVPFIPILDENFETWFKKDSLWQSEDLDAVADQDIQRTCILQGPVAAQFTNLGNIDQPVKDILDDIHNAHVQNLLADMYENCPDNIPVVEYLGGDDLEIPIPAGCNIREEKEGAKVTYSLPSSGELELPSNKIWFELLGGRSKSWVRALFTSDRILQGENLVSNPVQRIFTPKHDISVEISSSSNPEDVTIVLRERGSPLPLIKIQTSSKKEIIVSMTGPQTAYGSPSIFKILLCYHPETSHAPIHEIMENRNDRIKKFYRSVWLGNQPVKKTCQDISAYRAEGSFTVTDQAIKEFTHVIGRNTDEFMNRAGATAVAPMDFAIVIAWTSIMEALMIVDGDLLKLVHLSNKFQMLSQNNPFIAGRGFESSAQITEVLIQESGKRVEIVATINERARPVMKITSTFLYRGIYNSFSDSFQSITEPDIELRLKSASQFDLLKSKKWFQVVQIDPRFPLLGQVLIFRLHTFMSYETKDTYTCIHTQGQVLLETSSSRTPIEVATVNYLSNSTSNDQIFTNPVLDFLQRHGLPVDRKVPLEAPIPQGPTEGVVFTAPQSNEAYARVSKDYNPIHTFSTFASYADLPGPITHGMHTSALVRGIIDTWSNPSGACNMGSYQAFFCGMVRPGDEIKVVMNHIAMVEGRKVINIEAWNETSKEKVITAECEIEQARTAYFFTGQGSQALKMGMDLYESSKVARGVWDYADGYFSDNFGFKISEIVKKNPKTLTVHFGGRRGAIIRQNYLHMTYQASLPDGTQVTKRFFDIDEHTRSYTYHSANGLLHSTEFTQPALTVMEKASYDVMVDKGVIPASSTFAGHSLGEYSALWAVAHIMPMERFLYVVFYRGLSMKNAIDRGEDGRSNFAMVVVNPSRISNGFKLSDLEKLVSLIVQETNCLLEIVNHNIELQQYVCTGTLKALSILTHATDHLHANPSDFPSILDLIRKDVKERADRNGPITLQRGKATIPLAGLDVPFHSSFLLPKLASFREVLLQNIEQQSIDPKNLIGRYVPNVTARPFQITKESFEQAYRITKSDRLRDVLENWNNLYSSVCRTTS